MNYDFLYVRGILQNKKMQEFIQVAASAKCSLEDIPRYLLFKLLNWNLWFFLWCIRLLKSDTSKSDKSTPSCFLVVGICKTDWPSKRTGQANGVWMVSDWSLLSHRKKQEKIIQNRTNALPQQVPSKVWVLHSDKTHVFSVHWGKEHTAWKLYGHHVDVNISSILISIWIQYGTNGNPMGDMGSFFWACVSFFWTNDVKWPPWCACFEDPNKI